MVVPLFTVSIFALPILKYKDSCMDFDALRMYKTDLRTRPGHKKRRPLQSVRAAPPGSCRATLRFRLLPEHAGRDAGYFVEDAAEIGLILEPYLAGNGLDAFVGMAQQLLGAVNAVAVQIIPG